MRSTLYWDYFLSLSLLTEKVCNHAIRGEHTEVHFIPIEAVAREQVHYRQFPCK
jgi:hypothetical protein